MSRSLSEVLNEANPNKLSPAMQLVPAGDALGLVVRTERVAVASNAATLSRPAVAIIAAFATAAGSTGLKTPIPGAAPAAGQVGVGPTGTAVFAGADAVTQAEISYLAAEGEVFEEDIDVASNVGVALASKSGRVLLSAEVLAGGSTGAKTVVARGATPVAGQAALGATGTFVFPAADAVTRARVRYVALPGVGGTANVGTALASQVDF